jgi:hypothetical protein
VKIETSAVRVWRRLGREDRLAAAAAFWRDPPEILVATALGSIIAARHLRPQAARALSEEARVQALAAILDPGEALASSLLVALHLDQRRGLLAAFLDAVGLPHEDGLLQEDEAAVHPPLSEDTARAGVQALASRFPLDQVRTYLNTLWLQDPERWAALEKAAEWLNP